MNEYRKLLLEFFSSNERNQVQQKEKEKEYFKCNECGRSVQNLTRHNKEVHQKILHETKVKCPQCNVEGKEMFFSSYCLHFSCISKYAIS